MADQAIRASDAVFNEVIGDRQHRPDKSLVAVDHFILNGLTIALRGQRPTDKTTFGANRYNYGILDHLRLNQTEYFGAEIFRSVGPAQAAAGDLITAQMNGFHPGGMHPDFVARPRCGGLRNIARRKLQCVYRLLVVEVIVAAQRCQNQVFDRADQAVSVEALHLFQPELQLLFNFFAACFPITDIR